MSLMSRTYIGSVVPFALLGLGGLVGGCSSTTPSFRESSDDAGEAGTVDSVSVPETPGSVDSGPTDSPTAGAQLFFHVRASTAPFKHSDGYAGQTATNAKQGIRSMRLLREAGDTSPVVVFDHGKGYVEAGYNDGDDTLVGQVAALKVPAGPYKLAQIVVTHSRFRVASTLHYGLAYPGSYDCVQALSDSTTIDGVTHSAGWYRYKFETGTASYPVEGTNAPLPTSPTTGGFTMKTSGGDTYYETAIDLVVDPTIKKDVKVVIGVNMYESFRWEDQPVLGYAIGVYDTTPVSFEPVRRFGANSFTLSLE